MGYVLEPPHEDPRKHQGTANPNRCRRIRRGTGSVPTRPHVGNPMPRTHERRRGEREGHRRNEQDRRRGHGRRFGRRRLSVLLPPRLSLPTLTPFYAVFTPSHVTSYLSMIIFYNGKRYETTSNTRNRRAAV